MDLDEKHQAHRCGWYQCASTKRGYQALAEVRILTLLYQGVVYEYQFCVDQSTDCFCTDRGVDQTELTVRGA